MYTLASQPSMYVGSASLASTNYGSEIFQNGIEVGKTA